MDFEAVKNPARLPRDFSRVSLTLDNVLIDHEKLKTSPSMMDGISREDEISLRILGCELIQTAGILLKLPQTAMATGQVVFQRFYYSKSFAKHNYMIVSMASIYGAAKIEEEPRRLRDVLNVFHHMKQVRSSTNRQIKPLVLDSSYVHLKSQVIKAERRLMKELGFCVHVKHPHKIVVSYLQILGLVDNKNVIQYAWNLMNDSLRTDVFVRYSPEAIACACIFLATRRMKIPLPVNPPWHELFGVSLETIEAISRMMLHLYTLPKPDQDRLEKVCEEAKQRQLEEKRKARIGLPSLDGTPNSVTRNDSPKVGASPNGTIQKKMKMEDDCRVLENGSSEEKNGQKGKRRLDDSGESRSHGSGSHSRSRSSRSHSRSLSPLPKKKKRSYSPIHHLKRGRYDDYDLYYKEKRSSHKHKKHARSRSPSMSPVGRYSSSSKSSKKYIKEKRRSYSPVEKAHHSRKHRNGQRDISPRYDKYRR